MRRRLPPVAEAHDISRVLPPDARQRLVDASQVDPETHRAESMVRTRAVDFVVSRIKRQYPRFFY